MSRPSKKEQTGPLGHKIREHRAFNYIGRYGRSSINIKCPWCGSKVEAFVWSLAGSGKRCDVCPDVIHYTRISAKKPGPSKKPKKGAKKNAKHKENLHDAM